MSKAKRREKTAEAKVTPGLIKERRKRVTEAAKRGDWLAEYVAKCAKALDVDFRGRT